MLRPQQFATLVAARPAWFQNRGWLSMSALLIQSGTSVAEPVSAGAPLAALPRSGVQVGLTIPKRLCRRAVMRNVVKRLVRESTRFVYEDVARLVPDDCRLDVIVKLRNSLPGSDSQSLLLVKRELACASDELWLRLKSGLQAGKVPVRRTSS